MKEALHVSTAPSVPVCREDEQKRIVEFCKQSIEQEKAGSLYVCGCPGTGKSLSMENVKKSLAIWAKEVISICLIVRFVIQVELLHLHNYSHHLKYEDYNEWNHVLFPDRRSIPRNFGHKLYLSLNYFRNFQQGKNLSIH